MIIELQLGYEWKLTEIFVHSIIYSAAIAEFYNFSKSVVFY